MAEEKPQAEPQPEPKPPAEGALPQPTEQERSTAMLVHLLAIFTGFIVPLIFYLTKKEESKFIGYHAGQSLYLNLVGIPLSIVTCGLFSILMLVVDIMWLLKAKEGKWDMIPVVGKWAWPKDLPMPEEPEAKE